MVTFSYRAREQIKRLSSKERRELIRVLGDRHLPDLTQDTDVAGKFVSRLGANKRVVWEKADDGNVVVLSVVSKLASDAKPKP